VLRYQTPIPTRFSPEAAIPKRPAQQIVIVGAGASGALMAAHLLRYNPGALSVTLIEKRAELGRGLAYGAGNPSHLLNVRTANMSAFADDPGHFHQWLIGQGEPTGSGEQDAFRFVSRGAYGRYLESLLAVHLARDGEHAALHVVRDQAVEVKATQAGVEIRLAGGGAIRADVAILACGHESVVDEGALYLSPWAEPIGGGAPPDSNLLILGTGLTMIDAAIALEERGHNGRIVALSRRGLAPQAHRDVEALKIEAETAPFGADVAELCHWLRGLVRRTQSSGGDWRSVIDGLRPHTQNLWRAMTPQARRRFLDHARPWWDTHRHRMAPEVARRLQGLIDSGSLEIVAGHVVDVRPQEDGARVVFRRRGAGGDETLDVARILSCKGLTNDPKKNSNPLVQSLLAQGLARADALHIGLDVDVDCALIAADGRASRRLFAIGPMSQSAFWEITAVPDIRLQTAWLAKYLRGVDRQQSLLEPLPLAEG
jgi:uncharacterized NAD(P)/FAD-binding protein YdhS